VAARSLKVSALPVRAIVVGWGRQGVFRLLHLCAARGGYSQPQPPRLHVESGDASPGRAIDCGSAHRGQAPGAALPCKPRVAPAGRRLLARTRTHLVIAPATSLVNPGHPSPPGTIPLMSFPGEQMPCHAAQPARPAVAPMASCPTPMSPVCEIVFDSCTSTWQSALTFSLRHAAATACLQSMAKVSSIIYGLA